MSEPWFAAFLNLAEDDQVLLELAIDSVYLSRLEIIRKRGGRRFDFGARAEEFSVLLDNIDTILALLRAIGALQGLELVYERHEPNVLVSRYHDQKLLLGITINFLISEPAERTKSPDFEPLFHLLDGTKIFLIFRRPKPRS